MGLFDDLRRAMNGQGLEPMPRFHGCTETETARKLRKMGYDIGQVQVNRRTGISAFMSDPEAVYAAVEQANASGQKMYGRGWRQFKRAHRR